MAVRGHDREMRPIVKLSRRQIWNSSTTDNAYDDVLGAASMDTRRMGRPVPSTIKQAMLVLHIDAGPRSAVPCLPWTAFVTVLLQSVEIMSPIAMERSHRYGTLQRTRRSDFEWNFGIFVVVDNGIGQARLFSERMASLCPLGLAVKTTVLIEHRAWLNDDGIAFFKTIPPKAYLRHAPSGTRM